MANERLDLGSGARPDLAHHRPALADEDPLLRLGLHVEVRADDALPRSPSTSTVSAWGTSSRVRRSAFSRMTSATRSSSARSVGRSVGEVRGAFGQERDEVVAELVDALLRLRADRMQGVEVAERCRGLHLREHVGVLQPIDLVKRDETGLPSPKTRRATKRSPAPMRARASTTKSTASTSSKEESTVFCMRSVSGSSGRWKPGRSTSASW